MTGARPSLVARRVFLLIRRTMVPPKAWAVLRLPCRGSQRPCARNDDRCKSLELDRPDIISVPPIGRSAQSEWTVTVSERPMTMSVKRLLRPPTLRDAPCAYCGCGFERNPAQKASPCADGIGANASWLSTGTDSSLVSCTSSRHCWPASAVCLVARCTRPRCHPAVRAAQGTTRPAPLELLRGPNS